MIFSEGLKEGLNGLTGQRQTAKNITDYRQNQKKLLTTDREKINRPPKWSNIVRIFVFRNKSYFFIICLLFSFFCQKHFA